MPIFPIYAGLLTVFLLLYWLTARRILQGLKPAARLQAGEPPFISVVVAARDEEATIRECLEALAAQDFPRESHEVIVVNDASSDRTGEIARDFCRSRDNFRLMETSTERPTDLTGKQAALHLGISTARGTIIMITDADCRPSPSWISHTASLFNDRVVLVGGLTLPGETGRALTVFERLQVYDYLFLQSVAAGFANTGRPLSAIGNNLAFRKNVYDSIGGYPALGFSFDDDMQLVSAVREGGYGQVVYNFAPETLVRTTAMIGFGNFYRQRLRWLVGGYLSGISILMTLSLVFILHLMLLPGGVAVVLLDGPAALSLLAALILKSVIDGAILGRASRLAGKKTRLSGLLSFELFFMAYTSLLGLHGLFRPRRVIWKGRAYS
jgi:cellulose synthase/poly-beta-1,6-N-acetylglucosamine synthase-like glycosyltransferase